jgi:hypothetical protein
MVTAALVLLPTPPLQLSAVALHPALLAPSRTTLLDCVPQKELVDWAVKCVSIYDSDRTSCFPAQPATPPRQRPPM